jgi:site-specific DNA-methyltransferase (adenine-specific)
VARKDVTVGTGLIDEWKVYIPRAGSGSDAFPHPILGRPFLGGPGSICTETYLCIGPVAGETEARNVLSYISTRLFRFLVLLHKPTQDATRSVYTFVPTQDFSRPWTDDDLYAKYKISKAEVEFIEEMIRPMDLSDE